MMFENRLPKDWEIKKLGEVATFSQGIQVGLEQHLSEPKDGYVRFIRIVDYTQNTDDIRYVPDPGGKYYVNEDDIVMVRYGTPGLIGRGKAGVIANNLFRIKIERNDLTNDYLSLFLSQDNIQKYLSTQGSATMPALNFGQLKTVEVRFPPLPEQQRIVSILNECFAAIDKAKTNAEQNLKNAKELFESYLQGVFVKKGDGWEEKKLGEVLVKTETTDPTKNPDSEFTYLDVSSVNKETKEIETPTVLLGKDAPSRAKKLIKTDDVIFATVRPTHSRVAVIPEEFDEQVCSTGYFVLRTKESVNNKLVFYFLLTKGFNGQMEKLQKGASYPAVTDNDVKGILFRFPKSKTDQQNIVSQLDALRTETQNLEVVYQKKIDDLEELKKSILQKAFAGELKMSELGFDGLKDDKITLTDKKKILQSSNPINYNSDNL